MQMKLIIQMNYEGVRVNCILIFITFDKVDDHLTRIQQSQINLNSNPISNLLLLFACHVCSDTSGLEEYRQKKTVIYKSIVEMLFWKVNVLGIY